MTIAVFIESETDAQCLIPWGIDFAYIDHSDLLIVVPRRSKSGKHWKPLQREGKELTPLAETVYDILDQQNLTDFVLKEDIAREAEPSDMDRNVIDIQELADPDPPRAFSDKIESLDVSLLILPPRSPAKVVGEQISWHQHLFDQAPCEAIVVRGKLPEQHHESIRILIATDNENDRNTGATVKRGYQLAAASKNGVITLLFVRPDDDIVASHIAMRHLDKLANRLPDDQVAINKRVQLADSLVEGLKQQPLDDYDLVMVGTDRRKRLAQLFRQGELLDETTTALAAVRSAVPISRQLWGRFQQVVRQHVPQIDRELRISLVDRLDSGSTFSFDFVALISLATLIAALGLLRNSAAVVIGAMLVAPLMTPLVAIGFSLVQGNARLIRDAFKSVVLGFSVAIGIGAVLGMLIRMSAWDGITEEMMSRGSPNLLDLIVALASGIAAAYAMGRPHLVSALPGVAIAAALVPPIATSGLALTMEDFHLFVGALLLFAANIVAIVLGTAITFWAIGIDNRESKPGTNQNHRPLRWPRYYFAVLVVLTFGMVIWMSL